MPVIRFVIPGHRLELRQDRCDSVGPEELEVLEGVRLPLPLPPDSPAGVNGKRRYAAIIQVFRLSRPKQRGSVRPPLIPFLADFPGFGMILTIGVNHLMFRRD
jgi:hypothetical protein